MIIQSDLVNKGSRTVIVAPLLPEHKKWPFAVNIIPTKTNGLDKDRHRIGDRINLKQLRAVDISRIANKQGTLEKRYLREIKEALQIIFVN